MRKLLLSCFIVLICGQLLNAQTTNITEKPTTNWPFFFNDFVDAKVFLNDGLEKYTETKINVNFFSGEVQYLDASKTIHILENKDDVKEINVQDGMNFVFVDEFAQLLVSKNDKYMLTKRFKGKMSDVEESSGAYGSTTQSQAVDAINQKLIGGVTNFNYPSMFETRNEGTSFEPEVKYFLSGTDFSITMSKRGLTKHFKPDAKKISSYIKEEKISFKDEQDLIKLLLYIEQF